MNILFIVEGKRSEKKLYKNWIPYLCSSLNYVLSISELNDNNFTIITGGGYPNYFRRIKEVFMDIKDLNSLNYVLICIDSEDLSFSEKQGQMWNFIEKECPRIDCEIKVIVQNHCIETWLMGNKRINISSTSNKELQSYGDFHNVNILDPEDLTSIDERSIGRFTFDYLKLMLREKGLSYSKNNIKHVGNKGYFNQLVKRYQNDGHISSFGYFLNEFNRIII